jgi:hypothetical protein
MTSIAAATSRSGKSGGATTSQFPEGTQSELLFSGNINSALLDLDPMHPARTLRTWVIKFDVASAPVIPQ